MIMSSHKRPHLLKWGLDGLSKQKLKYDFEIYLLNDAFVEDKETVDIYNEYKNKLDIKYIHTGASKGADVRREQCFALNKGIKKCSGDIIILTSPEIYHYNENNINNLIEPFEHNTKILTTPNAPLDDRTSNVLNNLTSGKELPLKTCIPLNRDLNFCMGFWKKDVIDIGGFDEDFTGTGWDDFDIISRMKWNGSNFKYVDASIVHLFHPRGKAKGSDTGKRITFNKNMYYKKLNIIKRNVDREWGVL